MKQKAHPDGERHTEASQVEPLPAGAAGAPKAFRMGGTEVEVTDYNGVKALGDPPMEMNSKEGFLLLTPAGAIFAGSRHGHGIAAYTVSEYLMHCGAPASERVDLGQKVDAEGFSRLVRAVGLDMKGQVIRLDDSEPDSWEVQTSGHQLWRMTRDGFGLKLQWEGPEDYVGQNLSQYRSARVHEENEGGRLIAVVNRETKVYFEGMRVDVILAGPMTRFKVELDEGDERCGRVVGAFAKMGVGEDSIIFDKEGFRPKSK